MKLIGASDDLSNVDEAPSAATGGGSTTTANLVNECESGSCSNSDSELTGRPTAAHWSAWTTRSSRSAP